MKLAVALVALSTVSAQNGTPAQSAYSYRAQVTPQNWDAGGDRTRWVYLHATEVFPAAMVRRGTVERTLPVHLRREIGDFVVDPEHNRALAAWLPSSALDGFIIVHKGEIVFEQYPHMQPDDLHLMFSVTKAFVGTELGILEHRGRIDLSKPVEAYLPEFAGSAWAGTSVRDAADMASGMEGAEDSAAAYMDPKHRQYQMEASLGWRLPTPEMPTVVDAADTYGLLREFRRVQKPGERYVYVSANTLMLTAIMERVTGRRLADLIETDIWGKIGAEHDAQLLLNRKGVPIAHGGMVSTLRDLARFGIAFTQSGKGVLPQDYIDRLLHEGRPALIGPRHSPAIDHTSYQWDAISGDGEIVKGGFGDQLLYVNTRKDVVVAYFGTNARVDSMPTRLPLRKLIAQYF